MEGGRSPAFMVNGLFQHAQFLADFDKGGDTFVEMFLFVSGGNLNADTRLSFGYHRIVESGYENAFFLQLDSGAS